jgi:3-hydroxybutyryl-CoA dehydrogenase
LFISNTFFGHLGLGIAYVAALRAKVPVKLYDRSPEQISKGLKLMDMLLAKDIGKGKIQEGDARQARERVSVVDQAAGVRALRDVDMVIEVRRPTPFVLLSSLAKHAFKAVSENLKLKQLIFSELAAETRPDTILATNTSSISITKIAASAIPQGESAASTLGKSSAGRVVGKLYARRTSFRLQLRLVRTPFLQPCPCDGESVILRQDGI